MSTSTRSITATAITDKDVMERVLFDMLGQSSTSDLVLSLAQGDYTQIRDIVTMTDDDINVLFHTGSDSRKCLPSRPQCNLIRLLQHFVHYRRDCGEDIVTDRDWMSISYDTFRAFRISPNCRNLQLAHRASHRQKEAPMFERDIVHEFNHQTLPAHKDEKPSDTFQQDPIVQVRAPTVYSILKLKFQSLVDANETLLEAKQGCMSLIDELPVPTWKNDYDLREIENASTYADVLDPGESKNDCTWALSTNSTTSDQLDHGEFDGESIFYRSDSTGAHVINSHMDLLDGESIPPIIKSQRDSEDGESENGESKKFPMPLRPFPTDSTTADMLDPGELPMPFSEFVDHKFLQAYVVPAIESHASNLPSIPPIVGSLHGNEEGKSENGESKELPAPSNLDQLPTPSNLDHAQFLCTINDREEVITYNELIGFRITAERKIEKMTPEPHPVSYVSNGLLDTPGWIRFRGITGRENTILRMESQYSFQVPKTYKEDIVLDEQNSVLEMALPYEYNAFKDLGIGTRMPSDHLGICSRLVSVVRPRGCNKAKWSTDLLMDRSKSKLEGTEPAEHPLGHSLCCGRKSVTCSANTRKCIEKMTNSNVNALDPGEFKNDCPRALSTDSTTADTLDPGEIGGKLMFGPKSKQTYASPLEKGDHPEPYESEVTDGDSIARYQLPIGSTQWTVPVRSIGISIPLS